MDKKIAMICLCVFIAIFVIPSVIRAASFDCSKATTKTEKAICGDPTLSKFDEDMAAAYSQALTASDPDAVKKGQRKWLKEILAPCIEDKVCIKKAYEKRLRQLATATSEEIWLAKVRKNGKWGYINTAGEVVIPFQYDFAWKFSNGLAMVRKNRKNGYINSTGKLVIPFKSEHFGSFSNGLARIKKAGKYGYIDRTGKVVIPPSFEQADDFNEGLARVYTGGGWRGYGYIDISGSMAIPPQFSGVVTSYHGIFHEGIAAEIVLGADYGFVDKSGRKITPFIFRNVRPFSEGLAAVYKGGKWGYIDKAGEVAIPLERERPVFEFKEGLARVLEKFKFGYIDRTGKEAIPAEYDYAEDFSEGLAAVRNKSLWGYIDKTGKVVIPFQFQEVHSFSNGLAGVQADDFKWGYIDKTGRIVIPFQFEYAWEFNKAN